MFWGLILEPGKRYTTTVEKSFHVSMAAMDCGTVKQDQEIMSVMLETEGQESLLCNLCKQKGVLQERLDLNFLTGDTVTFTCRGSGIVHLSGYLVVDDDDLGEIMDEEEDEEIDEEDSGVDSSITSKKNDVVQKRKSPSVSPQQNKKKKFEAIEESDEEDEESSEGEEDAGEEEEGESDEEEDSEEGLSDEDDDDEDEEEVANTTSKFVTPQENKKAKQSGQLQQQKIKSQQNTPNKPQQSPGGKGNKSPMANGFTPQQQQQSGKKDKKKGGGQDTPGQGGQNKTPNQQKTPGGQKTPGQANVNTPKDKSPGGGNEGSPQKRTLEGGVVVKDLRQGNGQVAKAGKFVSVYYTGKLRSNNKVFDSSTDGAGFKFRLGRGEVIKGWDIGVNGMKVGGKRVIICPPLAAYGVKGSPPQIPPNSSLVFEVELKAVNN